MTCQLLRNGIGTVLSFRGLEHYLISFTAGKGPLDPRPLCQDCLLDSLYDLCVMVTIARCNLIIIESMNYMHDSRPSWGDVVDHLGHIIK